MKALLLLSLAACQTGELILTPSSKTSVLSAAVGNDTLYALSTEGHVLRRKLPSLEEPRVPVEIDASTTLSNVAFTSTGAAYFVTDSKITRVLGFENSVVTLLDVKVIDPFNVAASGITVYVSTEKEGLKAVDETSNIPRVIDNGVSGPITADDMYVYYGAENKIVRTSRENGSRDPMFVVDVPPGLSVKAMTFGTKNLIAALADSTSTAARTLYQVTPTGLLSKTEAVATSTSRFVADNDHIYYCASNNQNAGNLARVPLVGGKAQVLASSHCPFAGDATYLYVYGADGIRRVKKAELPKP